MGNSRCIVHAALCVAMLAPGFAAAAAASTDGPWYGLPPPSQRVPPAGELLPFDDLPSLLPPGDEHYADIRGEQLLGTVRDIVAISERARDAGDASWGRYAGSPQTLEVSRYMQQQFEALGLDRVWTEDIPIPASTRLTRWDVRLLGEARHGAGSDDVLLRSAQPLGRGTAAPIEAELVYVGLGTEADLLGRDLRGRIAVVQAILQPSPNSHTAAGVPARLAERGAVAVIVAVDVWEDLRIALVGASAGRVPVYSVNALEGSFLADVIARSGATPPRLRITSESEPLPDRTDRNTYGLLRGDSDETVLLTAHTDALFQGAADNASGLANMIALARHYRRPGAAKPRRSLLFVATSGHHAGSPGVRHIIGTQARTLADTVFILNTEHVASRYQFAFNRMRRLMPTNVEYPIMLSVTDRSPALLDLLGQAVNRYRIVVNLWTRHTAGGDPQAFQRETSVPVVNLLGLYTYYHTTRDVPAMLSPSGFERLTRALAWFLDRTMELDRAALQQGARPAPRAAARGADDDA
jgi:hypothetical protein